ncbi:MAG: hypothetical protein LC685_00685, partial [Actinobacteria bacterium]|nr:hypothetical protein [Actinomycetota bacterium]
MGRVALGTAVTAATGSLVGGAAGLIVAFVAFAATLSGELLDLVQTRSRRLRDDLLARLADVGAERADETIDARSHDPFGHVGRMLSDYRPETVAATQTLLRLEQTLAEVDRHLARTRARRAAWLTGGLPELIGGLAGVSESGSGLKRYGDPANLPPWLAGRRTRSALLRVGLVLDDIRLLHSADIEWAVLTFTLWARAILLVLAPTLGALSFAPTSNVAGGWVSLAPWALAVAWALGTALAAPYVATLAMEASTAGLRTRRLLLGVELPLAIALALTSPGWPVVAFAAGWTNWWQRIGRPPAIPDFSWPRLAIWIAVTAAGQAAGLILVAGGLVWWHAVLEVMITMGVIAVIGGSYGAMLPVSAGVAVRVLVTGARHRRRADAVAQRMIDDIAEAMARAADGLAGLEDHRPQAAAAADILRHAVDAIRPVAAPRRPRGPSTLGAVLVAALTEGGHEMWVADPRALAAQDRAREAGETLPAVVYRPEFTSAELAEIVVGKDVADTLHRLVVACVVEARVYGMRRVQTIISGADHAIEVRIANQPNPNPPRRRGRGRGGQTIRALAESLPGARDLFRGPTDQSFVGGRPAGELFGVRFTFTVGNTPAGAGATDPG